MKIIKTNRTVQVLFVLKLIALIAIGADISCSKSSPLSSMDPEIVNEDPQPRAAKPAIPPSSSFDLANTVDPFANLSLDGRRSAIGGSDKAEKYLRIFTKQLARVMADDTLRANLHSVVPAIEEGEIRISEIAKRFPNVLATLSTGFKNAVADNAISGDLAQQIQNSASDSEAIYKASRGLFELELSVASPSGQTWDPTQSIPVFYAPIGKKSSIEGHNASLESVSMPMGDGPSYTCLILNFDENMVASYRSSDLSFVPQHKDLWTWENITNLFSITTPAYAHYPPSPFDDDPEDPHAPCYSEDIIAPVDGVIMYYDHEDWPMGAPEIFIVIIWRQNNPPVLSYRTTEEQLEALDDEDHWYDDFSDLRARHGTCGASGSLQLVYIEEQDPWGEDDLGRWTNVTIPDDGFTPNRKDLSTNDVLLRIRRTTDDS